MIILELSHPIVWLVRHVCSDKAEFSFLQRKTAFWCSFNCVPLLEICLVNFYIWLGLNPFFIVIRVLVTFSVSFPFCKAQNFPLNGNTDQTLLPGQTPVLQDWNMRELSWHCLPPNCGGGLVQLRTRLCNPPPQVTLQLSHAPQDDQPPSTTIVSEVNMINKLNML